MDSEDSSTSICSRRLIDSGKIVPLNFQLSDWKDFDFAGNRAGKV